MEDMRATGIGTGSRVSSRRPSTPARPGRSDRRATRETEHDGAGAGLWTVVAGDHQLADLHPVRLQFHQAQDRPGLAFVRRVFRIPRRTVHRDVRISAHHLFSFGMADIRLSRYRLVRPRFRALAGDDVRLEGQPAYRALS